MVKKEQTSETQMQHGYSSQDVYPFSDSITVPETRAIQTLKPSLIQEENTFLKYTQVALGLIVIFALLYPLSILPGLIVVVLPAEIAIIGRVYDALTERNSQKTTLHRLPNTGHSSVPEIEETAIRPSDLKPYTT